ncbi:MAG TPA: bifunctional diguanylate cyclase/phosphodiesterase [Epsilonproteobacteria bacterium]|nr:bifunctional diguanylate cyclase/phosphodiesterase [Campylobacterota bacterium]
MREQYFNKFIILLIVLLIGFAVFLQISTEHSTEKLKNEEVFKAEQYVSNIAKLIQLRTHDKLEATLNTNPQLRTQLNEALHAFLTQQYQYIFVLKKDSKGQYRFLLDGARDAEEYHSLFMPQSTLFDEVYESGKMQIVQQEDEVKNLWLSLVYPIVINHKTEALLVLDFAKTYGEKLSHFNSPLMFVIRMMQVFLLLSIVLLLFLAYRYFKAREALIKDKLTSTYTKYYLSELFNHEKVNKYHAILIDLDAFKEINKKYGIEFGDKVIVLFSRAIFHTLSSTSKIIRTGGTEFLVLIPKQEGKIESLAHTLFATMQKQKYYYDNEEVYLGVSMSAMAIPENASSIQNVQRVLDEKLLEVKSKGKNALGIIDIESLENLRYSNMDYIKEALEEERLLCVYQPIYNTKSKEIVKYEALVRLIDKENPKKLISPFHFMDVIKGTSQYIKMSKLVFNHVFSTLQKYPEIKLSVNVDLDDLENAEMMEMIRINLEKHKKIANRLTFEILEEHEIKDYNKVQEIFKQLKAYGSKIALDDFGSGYASYGYLIRLDIDILKIDGTLIKELQKNPLRAKEVLKSIKELADEFGYEVVAEFVSHEDIYEMVKMLDITYSQGYYLGEPRPIEVYLP